MAEQTSKLPDSSTVWTGRLPLGLVIAMIALAGSLGAMLICWNLRWPSDNPFVVIVRSAAILCLGWGVVIHAVARLGKRFTTTIIGRDLISALQVVQTTFALITMVLVLYVALAAVLTRVPSLPLFLCEPLIRVSIWSGGSLDLALIGAALVLAWWRTGNGALITCVLWLGVIGSLWASLQMPDTAVQMVKGIAPEVWVDWISPFVLGSAASLAALTLLRELLIHRRRVRAWPDQLSDLLLPLPAWPGFRYTAGTVAAMVLILGCMTIVSPLTMVSSLLAGIAMLILTHRRWEENHADAAFGLITVSVISAMMFNLPQHTVSQAEHFPSIFSRAILGLALTTYIWHWIAVVWDQQLDQGRAWTTAGRLIRPSHRVGFIVAATGVLVSLQLAIWPILPYVDKPDNSPSRWIGGLLPNLLLIGGTMWATRKTRKSTLGWLAMLAVLSTITFVIVRIPGTTAYKAFLSHWPLILAITAGGCVLVARRCLRSTPFRPFFEPLYIAGILLLPMAAISGTSVLGSRAIPLWVDSATFLALAVVYLLAAFGSGPRRLAILAIVCAVAAAATLRGF